MVDAAVAAAAGAAADIAGGAVADLIVAQFG